MRSTSEKPPGKGETMGVAAGACLSAIALAAVFEMTLAPRPSRAAFSTEGDLASQRLDAALTVESLARVTQLTAPVPESLPQGVRASGNETYEVSRSALARDGNACDLFLQARIAPVFRDGQPVGFRLSGFRPNSPYARFGFHDGDVIRKINGVDMNSPEKALEVYTRLKDATRFEVDIERDCQIMRRTYLLQ
jgi:general secretion pathway protein C